MNDQPNVVYIADRPESKRELLERVFRQQEQTLRRFLRARLALEVDREDIAQEIFLKLADIDNLADKLADHSGNTTSYLFSIATNLIVDHKRRHAARRAEKHDSYREDELLEERREPTPDMIVASEQQLDRIHVLLKNLKPKCRQAFILSRFHQKSYPEIAREMGLSVPSVERYISLALAALRQGLK